MVKKEAKRLLMMAIAVVLLCTIAISSKATALRTYAETQTTTSSMKGDTDGDGKITVNDAYNLLLAYAKIGAGYDISVDMSIYDVDGNGKFDMEDSWITLMYIAKEGAGYKNLVWPPVNGSIDPVDPATTTTTKATTTTKLTTTTVKNATSRFNVGESLVFNGTHWNIRNGKNLKDASNIVGVLTHGTEFKILSVEGDEWYVVNAAGTVGYVNLADYWYFNVKSEATTTTTRATTTTMQTTTKATTTTTKLTTTTVKKTTATAKSRFNVGETLIFNGTHWNIRNGKDLKDASNIVGAFTHGTEFKILSVEGDEWYVVNAAGTVGYVNLADYWYFNVKSEATTTATRETTTTAQTTTKATTTTETTIQEPEQYEAGDLVQLCNSDNWRVRDSVWGNTIGQIYEDQYVEIVANTSTDGWYIIRWNDGIGYIGIGPGRQYFKLVGYKKPALKRVMSADLISTGTKLHYYGSKPIDLGNVSIENGNVLEVLRKDNTQITVSIDTWVFPVKPEIFDSGDFYQEN